MNYINRINELTLEIMELEKEIDYIEMQFKRIDREHGIRSFKGYIRGFWDVYCPNADFGVIAEIKHFGDRRQELMLCKNEKENERAELRRAYRCSSREEYFRPMDDLDIVMYITANGCMSGRRL